MSVTLNTSFDPGSFDPGKTYDKIKVISFTLDLYRLSISVTVGRGYVDGSDWVWARGSAGELLTTEHTIQDIPEIPDSLDGNGNSIPGTGSPADLQFSILVSKMGNSTKTIYDRAAEELYAWVIANLPEYAGTQD